MSILAKAGEVGRISELAPLSEAKRKLLQGFVSGQIRPSQAGPGKISVRPSGQHAPLSLAQEKLWRTALSSEGVPSFYNESITLHRTGRLDMERLEQSFTEIIRRHQAWRTTFDVIEGQPIQVIHSAPCKVAIPFVDLSGLAEDARETEALQLAKEHATKPFDLKKGPLVRALAVTLDEAKHRLFVTMHQSITDGVSAYQILPSELAALYEAFSSGEPSPLPELQVQYADFAYWERQTLQGQAFADQVAYWRDQYAGELESPQWSTRTYRSSPESFRGAIRDFELPKALGESLKILSQREEVTLFMTLLAGFAALLSGYTRQSDILVGTVAPAGRKQTEVQPLLGYFLNPVGLRINLSGNPTLRDLLRVCREVTLGALSHDQVPLEHLMEHLDPKSDPIHDPWLKMLITLAPPLPHLTSAWNQTPMDVDSGWAKWDLYVELSDRPSGIIGRAQYRTDVFTSVMISQFLEHFGELLQAFVLNPAQRVSDLPHLYASGGRL